MKGEVAVRNQLLSAMAEQQNLMDALTAVSVMNYVCVACVLLYLYNVHVHVYTCIIHMYIVYIQCTCNDSRQSKAKESIQGIQLISKKS